MKIIELSNINYKIKSKEILKNINLQVEKGEMIAIMGPSGSGKTTLVNILGLIEKAKQGEISIDGTLVKNEFQKSKILKKKISFIFQNYALVENKSVKFNISISDNIITRKKRNVEIVDSLNKVGLNKTYLTRKVASLSGGEQQRVAIARAIYRNSPIIIADEPTGNLDEANAFKVLDIFKAMKKSQKTLIIVTHDERIASYFDKIYYLKNGIIEEN